MAEPIAADWHPHVRRKRQRPAQEFVIAKHLEAQHVAVLQLDAEITLRLPRLEPVGIVRLVVVSRLVAVAADDAAAAWAGTEPG